MYEPYLEIRGLELSRDEMREVWAYYDHYQAMEIIWSDIEVGWNAINFVLYKQLLSDMAGSYLEYLQTDDAVDDAKTCMWNDYGDRLEELLAKEGIKY